MKNKQNKEKVAFIASENPSLIQVHLTEKMSFMKNRFLFGGGFCIGGNTYEKSRQMDSGA